MKKVSKKVGSNATSEQYLTQPPSIAVMTQGLFFEWNADFQGLGHQGRGRRRPYRPGLDVKMNVPKRQEYCRQYGVPFSHPTPVQKVVDQNPPPSYYSLPGQAGYYNDSGHGGGYGGDYYGGDDYGGFDGGGFDGGGGCDGGGDGGGGGGDGGGGGGD